MTNINKIAYDKIAQDMQTNEYVERAKKFINDNNYNFKFVKEYDYNDIHKIASCYLITYNCENTKEKLAIDWQSFYKVYCTDDNYIDQFIKQSSILHYIINNNIIKFTNLYKRAYGTPYADAEMGMDTNNIWHSWYARCNRLAAYTTGNINKTVKIGDIAYVPNNKKSFVNHILKLYMKCEMIPYTDFDKTKQYKFIIKNNNEYGFSIYAQYTTNKNKIVTRRLRRFNYPKTNKFGRGSYTIKSEDDSRQYVSNYIWNYFKIMNDRQLFK